MITAPKYSRRAAALAALLGAVLVSGPASAATAPSNAGTSPAAPAASDIVKMDAFKVEGIREGMARALDEQRASDNVTNVLASDSIGRFADLNLADALGRVSGISVERDQGEARLANIRGASSDFSSVAIDGVTMPSPSSDSRAMRLDTIPTDVVGSLEITKAITPNLDADNIGGRVNLRTQGAFERPGRAIRANLGYGFNELGGGPIHNIGLTYSDRFLPERNLGVLLSFSDYSTDRHTENIENNNWAAVPGDTTGLFRPTRPDTRTYELVRSRSSYTGRIDFKPGPHTRLYFSTVFSDWSDDEKRDNYRLPFATAGFQPGSTFPAGRVTNVIVDSNHNTRDEVNTIYSYTLGGEHRIGDLALDFVVSAGTASVETKRPNTYFNFVIDAARRPTIAYDFTDPDLPVILRTDGGHVLIAPPEDMRFTQFEERKANTDDDDLTVAFNATKPFQFLGRPATFRTGLKVRTKDKVRNDAYTRWTPAALPFTVDMRDMTGPELATNFGRYPWGFKTNRTATSRLAARIKAASPGVDVPSVRLGNFYEVSEGIWAGYGMVTTDIGRVRVVGGARVEHTKNSSMANQTSNAWATFRRVATQGDYTDVFPSLHFNYRPTSHQAVKLSFSTALARPSFLTLRPSEVIDAANLTISAGNPNVNPTKSYGADLYYELYLQPVGIFSAGVFAKRLDDPIFGGTRFDTRDGQVYTVSQNLNGSDGSIRGFEFNFERKLSFLPYPFDGFGVFSNYTYAKSEAELPKNPDGSFRGRVALQGTSKTTYNVAVFYEKGGFNARLSYVYRSHWLDSFNLATPALTRYWDERPQLDFTASVPVARWVSLYVQANNLTDAAGRRFLGNRTRVYELEGFGPSYLLGAKINF
jgi:TonB-dependent receptor